VKNVVNFICLRIQTELDKYELTGTVPHDLLEGAWNLDDLESCMSHLSDHHAALGRQLITSYATYLESNLSELKLALRAEYASTVNTMETARSDFMFPTVLGRYRADINPVKALYYDTREMFRRYNPEDHRHAWLFDTITDREFNNRLLDALAKDIRRLEKIITRYYWPFTKYSDSIPLELFHARQTQRMPCFTNQPV
jgi:hypothetical protein